MACILFRRDGTENNTREFDVAGSIFHGEFYTNRAKLYLQIAQSTRKEQNTVIARYCAMPFNELIDEVECSGGQVINRKSFNILTNLGSWMEPPLVELHSPKTWNLMDAMHTKATSFVVKGETNSKKLNWNTHMFAPSMADIGKVAANLLQDSLITYQNLYIREYVPLRKLDMGINGLPISEEYRVFVYGTNILCSGYYWSNFYEDVKDKIPATTPKEVLEFAQMLATNIKEYWNLDMFYTLDIAYRETPDPELGKLVLIEMNEGQMSGLSECDPFDLYTNLRAALNG
jgi:hypothetical protein